MFGFKKREKRPSAAYVKDIYLNALRSSHKIFDLDEEGIGKEVWLDILFEFMVLSRFVWVTVKV